MAINFEAANMAGYNNPKIEVFKAVLTEDGATLAQYPDKAAIIAAVNRGSVPFLMLTTGDHDQIYILPISYLSQSSDLARYSFSFSSATHISDNPNTGMVVTVRYGEGVTPPVLIAQGIPKNNI